MTESKIEVFLSWSSQRSKAMATILHEWIPLVADSVLSSWMSDKGIQPGERWSETLGKQLEHSDTGIICLTKENLRAPWVLFEAGAIAKSMNDGRITPVLLDVAQSDFVDSPFQQFQSVRFECGELEKLILNLASNAPPPTQTLIGQRLEHLRTKFEPRVRELEKATPPNEQTDLPAGAPPDAAGKVLDNLLARMTSLEDTISQVGSLNIKKGARPETRQRMRQISGLLRGLPIWRLFGESEPQTLILQMDSFPLRDLFGDLSD